MDLHVGKLHTMGLDGNGAGQVECETQRQHKGNEQQERNGLQEQRREYIFHQRSCASGLELSLSEHLSEEGPDSSKSENGTRSSADLCSNSRVGLLRFWLV
jgi:hypothetical protein